MRADARLPSRLLGSVLFAALQCVVASCAEADEPGFSSLATSAYPKAGLFTPGSRIGYQEPEVVVGPDGGTGGLSEDELRAVEESIRSAGMEDRCTGSAEGEGTPGSLTIQFQSDTYHGFYEPENVGVVWIEDEEGQYLATPLLWAEIRTRNLFVWDARRCRQDFPDVISSATLDDHSSLHTATWDGLDHNGKVVPDGTYYVNIEVSEDEFNYGRRAQYAFEKSDVPFTLAPEDMESVLGLELAYTPDL